MAVWEKQKTRCSFLPYPYSRRQVQCVCSKTDDNDLKYEFASELLYLVVLFLSKCCVSCLFLRLTPGRAHMRMIWAIIIASSVWATISVILVAIRCNPSHPWTDNVSTCSTYFARWAFIGAMDAIIEIALVANSVYIVSNLQMALKSKVVVVGAFSWRILYVLRLPISVSLRALDLTAQSNVAFTCTRLAFLSQPLETSTSHIWDTRVVCTTQLAIGYTITAAVIPYLKPFMMAYEPPDKTHASTYPSSNGTRLKMSNLSSSRSGKATDTLATMDFEDDGALRPNNSTEPVISTPELAKRKRSVARVARMRPERTDNEITSASASVKDSEHGSDDSERLIIKKDTEWRVEYSRD